MAKNNIEKSQLVERIKQQAVTIHQLTHHLQLLQSTTENNNDTENNFDSNYNNISLYSNHIGKSNPIDNEIHDKFSSHNNNAKSNSFLSYENMVIK
jgi:hypothetical protein